MSIKWNRILLTFLCGTLIYPVPSLAGKVNVAKDVIISADASMGVSGGWRASTEDVDDAAAILMAIDSDKINLLGVSVLKGNTYVDNSYEATKHLFSLMDDDTNLPIILRGASHPIEVKTATLWTGDDELKALPLVHNKCVNESVEFMREKIKTNKGLTLLSMGPLSDIACLIQVYPEVVKDGGVAEIVVLMGREKNQALSIEGVTGLTDFNFVMDSRAAEVVFEQKYVPVTVVPFSVSSSVFIPFDMVPTPDKSSALELFMYGSTEVWVNHFSSALKLEEKGFYPWDGHVVNYLIDPDAYTCSQMGYEIKNCTMEGECAGHDEKPIRAGSSLAKEAKQLWISKDYTDTTQHHVCNKFANGTQAEEDFKARMLGRY